jgi:hypothetical protein
LRFEDSPLTAGSWVFLACTSLRLIFFQPAEKSYSIIYSQFTDKVFISSSHLHTDNSPLMELDDLYGDLDAAPKQLPSAIELRGRLTEVVNEREALEAQLQALQSEEQASRAALRDLMHRASVLLATARLELQRKDKQLNEYGITVPAK